MREGYGIGELSRRAGVRVANIRYYEEIGILPKAGRGPGGRRSYDGGDLKRLGFVKNCRKLGYPLRQVRALLHLSQTDKRTCNEARNLAAEQLAVARRRIIELRALEAELEEHVAECDAQCCNGPAPDCSIFRSLSS
jgi:DNA-binding transcriptional MerR regulator